MSTAFAPLARVVSEGIGHGTLPIIVVPHPVGDGDEAVILQRGADIANECVRMLTTHSQALVRELEGKSFALPAGVMPR
ncbi:MAG: hypothetical protein V4637_03160 [Pseudomonadota bacterium]